MKKILLLLLAFLTITPYISYAETCSTDKIEISSISVLKKSKYVDEKKPATISNKTISFSVNMYYVDDYITYKVKVKNDTDEDYYLNEKKITKMSEFLDYILEFDDNSNVVKANSSKDLYLTIKYKKKVAENSFVDRKYNDYKSFSINLANEELINPNTFSNIFLSIIIFIIVFSITLYIIIKNKKKAKIMAILIASIILIPSGVYAICKYQIVLESDVTIYNGKLSSFGFECFSDRFEFLEGMTVKDWLQSDFYKGNIGGNFKTLDQCKKVWGEKNNCHFNQIYDYFYKVDDEYITYTDSLEECNAGSNCAVLDYDLYKCTYVYASDVYDTLEECETYYEDTCFKYNDKYIYSIESYFYDNVDDIPESLDSTLFYSCSKVPVGYKYNRILEYYIDSYEDCIENYGEDKCGYTISDYYSPNTREGEYYFYINENNIVYGGHYISYLNYDELLENKLYECEFGAECVDPNSDILSGNGKTIKAKDIKENDLIAYYDFKTNKVEIGTVKNVYIHKDANSFIKYVFNDKTYLKVTDYHPIYTSTGWKSYTNRNGYPKPNIGDLVKTNNGYKKIKKIVPFNGKEDYYDFVVRGKDGRTINNYFANGILVQGSY